MSIERIDDNTLRVNHSHSDHWYAFVQECDEGIYVEFWKDTDLNSRGIVENMNIKQVCDYVQQTLDDEKEPRRAKAPQHQYRQRSRK